MGGKPSYIVTSTCAKKISSSYFSAIYIMVDFKLGRIYRPTLNR